MPRSTLSPILEQLICCTPQIPRGEVARLIWKARRGPRVGRQAARDRLVFGNMKLVICFARKWHGRQCGLPIEDLVQEGTIGLMKAVDGYDGRRNVRFSTYATRCIEHAIQRAASDQRYPFRIPENGREVHATPTTKRGVRDRKDCIEAAARARKVTVLPLRCDLFTAVVESTAEHAAHHDEQLSLVRHHMLVLNPRNAKILAARYGLDGLGRMRTDSELSTMFGVNRSRAKDVCQRSAVLVRKSIAKHRALSGLPLH